MNKAYRIQQSESKHLWFVKDKDEIVKVFLKKESAMEYIKDKK